VLGRPSSADSIARSGGKQPPRRRRLAPSRRDSAQQRAVDRAKVACARAGYVYLHSAINGFPDRPHLASARCDRSHRGRALGAAPRFFPAHGITRITRAVPTNGSCYRSTAFACATGHAGAR
jgi:hypothetical protein